jgi:hypothetical protein
MNLHLVRTLSRSLPWAVFSLATSAIAQDLSVNGNLSVTGDADFTRISIGANGLLYDVSNNFQTGDIVLYGNSGVSLFSNGFVNIESGNDMPVVINGLFVGIGTYLPAAKLDVDGDAIIRGSLTVAGQSVVTANQLSAYATTAQLSAYATSAAVTAQLAPYQLASGSGANLTSLNASQLTTGIVPVAVIPSSVVQTTTAQTLNNKTLTSATLTGTTTTSGNVGIQTTSPQGSLTLGSGQLTTPAGAASAPTYTFNDNLNTGFYSSGTNSVSVATNGVERLRVYNNGNLASDDYANLPGVVGNAAYKSFHLASPTVKGSTMISLASRNFSTAFLGDRIGDFIIGNEGARPIIFKNGMIYKNSDTLNTGTEQMRIAADGKVGIGQSAPTEKLDVVGNVKVSGAVTMNAATVKTTLRIPESGDLSMGGFRTGTNPAN